MSASTLHGDVQPYSMRKRLLQMLGAVFFALGLYAAILGPLEFVTFYFYSPGGRWHYEGFGFGSLWFGVLAIQIIGFYLVAAVLIPLGYGHLRLRPWVGKLSLTVLWGWLVLGLPCALTVFTIFVLSKEPPEGTYPVIAGACLLMYPVLPVLMIRIYRSPTTRAAFQQTGGEGGWIERTPQPILVLGGLMVFFILALHVLFFLNGVFPVFGGFVSGMKGIFLTDLAIFLLAVLTYGVFSRRMWAWWGAIVYFALLALSYTLSFLMGGGRNFIDQMRLSGWELKILEDPPHGIWFVLLFVPPMIATLVLIAFSRRHFHPFELRALSLSDVYMLLLIVALWALFLT
ncbi:MAG: hypothetical protein FVQ81_12370 [Candidatus Glassbacteria bacterium]|nr:hypothetical protein [Candidatus Glassbacteria bacterium]